MSTKFGPKVYWITGLSGAGKTTLANALIDAFRRLNLVSVLVDGDVIRELYGDTESYDRATRLVLSKRYSQLCRYLLSQGVNVVCSTISLFHETQAWNRKNIPAYYEIFLDVSQPELMKRDYKKIYDRALKGELKNVVGVDILPEYPKNPDLCLKCNENLSVEDSVKRILQMNNLYLNNDLTAKEI